MTDLNISSLQKMQDMLAQLDTSPTVSLETLMNLMIANEKMTEDFFHIMTKMFAHQPDAASVWMEMAADEALHAWLLERTLESFSSEQLAAVVAPEIVEHIRQEMTFVKNLSPIDVLERIITLEDAYQEAHSQEYYEFCTVTDFVLSQEGIPDEILRTFLRSNLEEHIARLQKLGTPDRRQLVPAHHFWKA